MTNTKETGTDQAIVQQIIDVFWTQDRLAHLVGVDQSTVSGWLKRGIIPTRRQRQIMDISKRLANEGKIKRPLVPTDFYAIQSDLQGQSAAPAA